MSIGFSSSSPEAPLVLRRCDNCDKTHAEIEVRNEASYYNRKTQELEPMLICDHCDYTFRKAIRQKSEKQDADRRSGTTAKVY